MKEKKYMRDDADGAGLVAGFKFAERTTVLVGPRTTLLRIISWRE